MTTDASYRLIAAYRLPREGREDSRYLRLYQSDGDRTAFLMVGGLFGTATVQGDARRAYSHWAGYCSNSRGRAVRPARPRFLEAR